jgi:hypothetical protein
VKYSLHVSLPKHLSHFLTFFLLYTALFANGRTICFGDASYGQVGTNDTTDVISTATQAFVSFADNALAITGLSAGGDNFCVIRCDNSVICIGSNANGQVGQNLSTGNNFGDSGTEVASAAPISFNPSNIVVDAPILTSLTFSAGTVLPMTTGQTFYNTVIYGETTVWVSSYAAAPACGSTVTVNGASPNVPIALFPHGVTTLTVVVASTATTTYTIAVRRIADTHVSLGNAFACLRTRKKIVCWGVRIF